MFCVGLLDSIAAATSADELKMPLLLFHYSKLLKMQVKMQTKKNKEIH